MVERDHTAWHSLMSIFANNIKVNLVLTKRESNTRVEHCVAP